MASYSSSVYERKYCDICGALITKKIGKKLGHYCSFSCSSIGIRGWTLASALILLPIGIIAFLIIYIESSARSVYSITPTMILTLGVVTLTISSIGFLKYNKRIKSLSMEGNMFKSEIIDNISISKQYSGPITFSPSSGSLVCAICKMKLYKREEYYQCTICLTPFHTKHIIEWLTIKNECPVCKNKYI